MPRKIIEPSLSQSQFLMDYESKGLSFCGGFGSGKTFIAVMRMVQQKLLYPDVDLAYLLPTFGDFRLILYPTVFKVLEGTGIKYKINKNNGEIEFANASRVILKSMNEPETIVGFNVLSVFLDEFDTLPAAKAKMVWEKALARARERVHKRDPITRQLVFNEDGSPVWEMNQMLVVTTPEGFRETHRLFVKEKPDNYRLIRAKAKENKFLPADYYSSLEAVYSPELLKAYRDGEFVNLTAGSVYGDFQMPNLETGVQGSHCEGVYREGEILYIGLDFNVRNTNGAVFVKRSPLTENNARTQITKDYQYYGKEQLFLIHHFHDIADTNEMVEVIKNRYPRSPIYCYPDSSGKNVSSKGITLSDISILKDAGFICRYPSKNPRVLDRVKSLNAALKTGLVRVNVDACPEIADALMQQVYNENTQLPDKKISSKIDDINDSVGYMIHYMYPIVKKTIKSIGVSNY